MSSCKRLVVVWHHSGSNLKECAAAWLQAIANKLRDLVGELLTACCTAVASLRPAASSPTPVVQSMWHQHLDMVNDVMSVFAGPEHKEHEELLSKNK
jgi:hypothetical protein